MLKLHSNEERRAFTYRRNVRFNLWASFAFWLEAWAVLYCFRNKSISRNQQLRKSDSKTISRKASLKNRRSQNIAQKSPKQVKKCKRSTRYISKELSDSTAIEPSTRKLKQVLQKQPSEDRNMQIKTPNYSSLDKSQVHHFV